MRINYNESAILSNACVNRADSALSLSIEKLSSGYKINHARDNPAGLAISHRMNSQIRGLSQAKDNTNDGISVVETADGAMEEITSIIQRMNQLAIQAGTDSTLDADRELLNDEIQQLKKEITRISTDTQFNGQTLLDGTFDLKGYTTDLNTKVEYYSDEVKTGKYEIDTTGLVKPDGSVDISKIQTKEGFKNLHNISAETLYKKYKKLSEIQFLDSSKLDIKDITIQLARILLKEQQNVEQSENNNNIFVEFFKHRHSVDFYHWVDTLIQNNNEWCDGYDTELIGWELLKINDEYIPLIQGRKNEVQNSNMFGYEFGDSDDYQYRINPIYYNDFCKYFDKYIRPQM